MGELFAEIGDLVFTLVIGYISAIEFLYVVRHLYHYSCNHDANADNDAEENVAQLQDSMREQLVNAKSNEAAAGTQVMKDGVPYKEGYRLEAQQALIDQLKEQLKDKELSDMRRQELEKELAKQKKIAEQLRKELAEAEAKYQRQLKEEEAAKAKKLLEEQKKLEREERAKKEAEEQARKIEEAEKQREAEQRKREEQERLKKEAEQKERERKQFEEQQRQEAEEQSRKLAEAEKQREAEQRQREQEAEQKEKERLQHEAEENARRLAEAEKQREIEQKQREETEENARKLQEAERQREIEQRMLEEEQERANQKLAEQKLQEQVRQEETEEERRQQEAEENARRLLEIEKANEEKLAAEEAAAELATKSLLAIEHRLEEQLRAAEKEAELTEKECQLIESIKKREFNVDEGNEHKEAELLRRILEAREQLGEESEEEQSLRLVQRERDQEAKQRRIEENALLFMEAEKEMADLQSEMLDAVEKRVFSGNLDSAPQTPIIEEPCIKRNFSPLSGGEAAHSTVKTQLAQDLDEPYSVRTKPLLFPGVSDDTSSIDPVSSQQSSFSTQFSEEITTGTDSQYPVHEQRQEPDGEDTNLNNLQYSDDYLRSLDGIKQRPLVREDGSGRRRAFKKRRSSNSSNSSRDSRHSRDEELKMFTSLEEEEMKDHADSEFTPIRYSTEPTLKVKGHHRRHKRSPAKDMRRGDDSSRSSLERLGEETGDPWGEVKPEHYKQTEFWKREKALSIDEEMEFEKPASSEEVAYDTATNMPSASSFEEATQKQNQQAFTSLQQSSSQKNAQEGISGDQAAAKDESARSDNTNLQISQTAEKEASPARSSRRLRRSPHIEETDQYEENRNETKDAGGKSAFSTAQNTPTINVQTPLDFGPWRDEYGLIMEGLSDFYDFTASVNPSRSRSASRNVSPANTAPNTPQPKDVSLQLHPTNETLKENRFVEIYDDTDNLLSNEFRKENIINFIDSLSGRETHAQGKEEEEDIDSVLVVREIGIGNRLQYVADDASRSSSSQATLLPLVNVIDDGAANVTANSEDNVVGEAAMHTLVSSLRLECTNRSRSRSKSPLPTPDNLKRSVENRRYKMIKHNEDILEKLIESNLLPELTPPEEPQEKSCVEKTPSTEMHVVEDTESSSLVQSLHVESRQSRSRSPMRLPTPENLSKGLEKRRSKLIERNDEFIKQLEERSQTPESPTIVVEHVFEMESSEEPFAMSPKLPQTEEPLSPSEEENCSRENMDLLVQSLRAARSRTSSKSPMRIQEVENVSETSETKIFYGFQQTEHVAATQHREIASVPTISIVFSEAETEVSQSPKAEDEDDCSREKMDLLIQSLRIARSRSTSKSPMFMPMEERAKTPEPSGITEIEFETERSRHSRSKSPSRSHSQSPGAAAAYRSNTPSRSLSPEPDSYDQFNVMLNLEGSHNRTLAISGEEQESLQLADSQRHLDEEALVKLRHASQQMEQMEEALGKLRNASQEMELRTVSPLIVDRDELSEKLSQDYLAELPLAERTKLMRKSPTTPDYDRTISEEMRDVERIKQKMIQKGFKRSTYVGESMDLGSEFEPLRKEAAKFQRSRSPSPSFSTIENATAQRNAEDKRKIQDLILQELTIGGAGASKEFKNTGAIPKTERFSSCEIELSLENEVETTRRIREEISHSSFQRSTHAEYSEGTSEQFAELRRRNAEFRRSVSTSRSPLNESQLEELAGIEEEATKRTFKDKMLDEVSCNFQNRPDFSECLNTDFLDNNRRASDSALMKLPQILVHHNKDEVDMEPEEYHHFRRFSLAQEEPVDQYPGDDYIFIEQVEVRTRSGSRTWLREDFYSENVEEYLSRHEKSTEGESTEELAGNGQHIQEPAADDEEEYSNASDDDRQTVVEVDDEIDEDISDFNERGPAEESHHETSECEEAEREMDRYADREASDWNRIVDVDNMIFIENRANETVATEQDEGAVGGLSSSPYDSDSFAIDQIYDEAIKNRKQSGILREYDSILMQMSQNSDIDEQYLLWSKTNDKKSPKNIEFNTQFLDSERKGCEMRYLGDANVAARQSARLRSRYGYSPVLPGKCLDDDVQVDLNYKPKREYNWRKNFRLDDDAVKEDKEVTWDEICNQGQRDDGKVENQVGEEAKEEMKMELRTFSLGGESVTLFSRSPERIMDSPQKECGANEDLNNGILSKEEVTEEKLVKVEKPKKKKTKKKSHKESKAILEETMNREDEDAYDNQVYSRRSSSLQMDTDSPKRKSRSRRSSKSSVTNEDSMGLFSPRSSVACNEGITDILEEFTDVAKEPQRPKKMKKRKKVKDTTMMAHVTKSLIENKEELEYISEPLNYIEPVSTAITPDSCSANILSTLSPQNSVCVTPASSNLSLEDLRENMKDETINKSCSTTDTSPSEKLSRTSSLASAPSVDTFDILKDANFYPLF